MSKVSAEDVVRSLFDPGETVHVRIFDDKKSGTFTGMKLAVEAGKFSSIMEQLKKHNALNRGIFFVVNAGGDDDKSITRGADPAGRSISSASIHGDQNAPFASYLLVH